MPGIGIGIGNFNGARKGLPYPTKDLQLITYNSTYEDEGTTYLRTSIGIGIPKVSGSGLDAIWDFSVLNDLRFNKNAYLGNEFGLPEYYNFPYVDIYFDTNNPYHWKLTDFHYANLDAQTDLTTRILQDWAFLNARATSNTSNEIEKVIGLVVYSQNQTETEKLKTWAGIQPDFEGDEMIQNNNFETTDYWILDAGYSISNNELVSDGSGGIFKYAKQTINICENCVYNFRYYINDYTSGNLILSSATFGLTIDISETLGYNEIIGIESTINSVKFFVGSGNSPFIGKIRYVSLKQYFKNYYKK